MGVELYLELDEDYFLDKETAKEYYRYKVKKARNHRPRPVDGDADADWYRRLISDDVERENGRELASARLTSGIRDIEMADLFTRDTSVIYGTDIQIFIDRLRDRKKRAMREADDESCEHFWDRFFELELIVLCEFAFEYGYGIRLSD